MSQYRPTKFNVLAAGFSALALGAISACFNAPASDVLFSCASGGEPACPKGYSCEADGCCHKKGSDIEASLGACGLGLGGDSASTQMSGDTGDTSETGE